MLLIHKCYLQCALSILQSAGPKEKLDSTAASQPAICVAQTPYECNVVQSTNSIFIRQSAGPKEKLDSTAVSQPAIYVASLAAVEKIRATEGQAAIDAVDVAAGLSLGEYTALAFAGAVSFEDGLKLVKLRGESMQARRCCYRVVLCCWCCSGGHPRSSGIVFIGSFCVCQAVVHVQLVRLTTASSCTMQACRRAAVVKLVRLRHVHRYSLFIRTPSCWRRAVVKIRFGMHQPCQLTITSVLI